MIFGKKEIVLSAYTTAAARGIEQMLEVLRGEPVELLHTTLRDHTPRQDRDIGRKTFTFVTAVRLIKTSQLVQVTGTITLGRYFEGVGFEAEWWPLWRFCIDAQFSLIFRGVNTITEDYEARWTHADNERRTVRVIEANIRPATSSHDSKPPFWRIGKNHTERQEEPFYKAND